MKKLEKWIKKLGIRVRVGLLQKTTLLGMARILRKVPDFKVPGSVPRDPWLFVMTCSLGLYVV